MFLKQAVKEHNKEQTCPSRPQNGSSNVKPVKQASYSIIKSWKLDWLEIEVGAGKNPSNDDIVGGRRRRPSVKLTARDVKMFIYVFKILQQIISCVDVQVVSQEFIFLSVVEPQ